MRNSERNNTLDHDVEQKPKPDDQSMTKGDAATEEEQADAADTNETQTKNTGENQSKADGPGDVSNRSDDTTDPEWTFLPGEYVPLGEASDKQKPETQLVSGILERRSGVEPSGADAQQAQDISRQSAEPEMLERMLVQLMGVQNSDDATALAAKITKLVERSGHRLSGEIIVAGQSALRQFQLLQSSSVELNPTEIEQLQATAEELLLQLGKLPAKSIETQSVLANASQPQTQMQANAPTGFQLIETPANTQQPGLEKHDKYAMRWPEGTPSSGTAANNNASTSTQMIAMVSAQSSNMVTSAATETRIELSKSNRERFENIFGRIDPIDSVQSSVRATLQTVATRADLPMPLARQIAEAMHRAPDRGIELTLSPAELGRVRMLLTPGEASMSVSILVERQETLDLLRRNIDTLNQAMVELGYENIQFDFATGGEHRADAETASNENDSEGGNPLALVLEDAAGAETSVPIAQSSLGTETGLDMRL